MVLCCCCLLVLLLILSKRFHCYLGLTVHLRERGATQDGGRVCSKVTETRSGRAAITSSEEIKLKTWRWSAGELLKVVVSFTVPA